MCMRCVRDVYAMYMQWFSPVPACLEGHQEWELTQIFGNEMRSGGDLDIPGKTERPGGRKAEQTSNRRIRCHF